MRSMTPFMAATFLMAAVLSSPAAQAVDGAKEPTHAVDAAPVRVQFRDLFNGNGKPTDRAVSLSGQFIEIVGFFTPPPTRESPFRVLVGAPTAICPYCTAINEVDHLPYVLVYADEEIGRVGLRARMRIVGQIFASHDHEQFYGLHNDIRIIGATITPDARAERRRPRGAFPQPAPGESQDIDYKDGEGTVGFDVDSEDS